MKFEHTLGLFFFTLTAAAYLILFSLGRKWRKEFEGRGITYWQAPKEERLRELTSDVWRPKLIAVFYSLAYFANGYNQMYMSISWVGNIPASIIIGYLLPTNIPLLFAVLSSFTLVPLFLVRYLKPYEAAKAIAV